MAEDLAGLKAQVAERLEAEFGGASRAVQKRKLLDALLELEQVDSATMVAQRVERLAAIGKYSD